MELLNLTGHEIVIVDSGGNIMHIIPESEYVLRCSISYSEGESVLGIPVKTIRYSVDISEEEMTELALKYSGIIVSKITGEALRRQGFSGDIYITGRKFHMNGDFVGVRELSKI